MREISKSRVISFVIAAIEILMVFLVDSIGFDYRTLLICAMFGFACVWFGEEMGGWKGTSIFFGFRQIKPVSSGGVMRFFGWILLFVPIIVVLYKIFQSI